LRKGLGTVVGDRFATDPKSLAGQTDTTRVGSPSGEPGKADLVIRPAGDAKK
jgi:hypothetical protein